MNPISGRIDSSYYRLLVIAASAGALLAFSGGAFAQAPAPGPDQSNVVASPLAVAFNEGVQAFGRGDWARAAQRMEDAIGLLTDPKDKAKASPVYYTRAAAYFNMANYPKAIEAFNDYLTKYPAAEKVGEARLALARATFLNKDYENAARLFANLESAPALREQALIAESSCYKELNKPDSQIPVLERLIAPEIKDRQQANAAVELADLYLNKHQNPKAIELLNKLRAHVGIVDNVVALNVLTVKLGDELAAQKEYAQAISAYHVVRTREQVIAIQTERIAAMTRRMEANTEAGRKDPQSYLAVTGANNEIKAEQDKATALLEEFQKLPDYWPAVLFRMGKAWYDWGKKWESIVVFERLLADLPDAAEREQAMYSILICYADLNRFESILKTCDRYLAEFPKGPNAGTVGYLKGAAALQAGDVKGAVTYFGTTLEQQPENQYREQIRFLLGNAHFSENDFEAAQKDYLKYLQDFPTGSMVEEAKYREALTHAFTGKYEEALAKFEAYLKEYPNGTFIADAGYRVMICKYAASLYDEVIADATAWDSKFSKEAMAGEVSSLKGDSLAAQDKTADAAAAYIHAFKVARTDEVLNYALFEAAKQLQKEGKWTEIAEMFQDFVKDKPDHPSVVGAMVWIAKAKSHEGKTEEAKTFLVEQLGRYINEPKREAVEQILQQLVQLCLKRPRPTPSPSSGTDAAAAGGAKPLLSDAPPAPVATSATLPAAAPAATPTPYDAPAELKKQLAPLDAVANATGRARLLYAQAELATWRRHPDDAAKVYADLARNYKIEDLSPVLLAQVGDYLLKKGDKEAAGAMFERLKEDFPKSAYLDFAYAGLGELALDKGQAGKALELYTYAADEIAASKIKDSTVGKARALLELKRYAEAKKLFEQAASIKEWRGETTAMSIYYLGEVEARQDHWAEAIAYYQRVFVAYQKFHTWAAKAYVRSAEAFEKLGKRPEAVAHLRELLRNERMKDLPETTQATKMLANWGASS